MGIVVITRLSSPYQVELFNTIAVDQPEFRVAYLHQTSPNRQWKPRPANHERLFLDDPAASNILLQEWLPAAECTIFNYYKHPLASRAFAERAKSGKPWCFWGERPGFRKPAFVGRLLRLWKLRSLHCVQAPIWGIGRFAIEGYRAEFGSSRQYQNIPYFSDLAPYARHSLREHQPGTPRTILFSGSLIPRKGVDLLARAFLDLAREHPHLRLKIMGAGPLEGKLAHLLASVSSQVEFLGFQDWDELPAAYAQADVLCVPSRYDGWGLVVPEGLASGLPVIATDRMGAALEFIQDGHNGWLIKAGRLAALTAALHAAATLPDEKLLQMSTAARDSVKEHTLENGAKRFLAAAADAIRHWQS